MFLICGEALYDVFIERETPTGLLLDARIGGSPYNVAVGLARLGQRAGLLTGLSSDALGDRLAAAMQAEGVETRYLARKPELTTLALVGLDPAGQARYSFYSLGAADRAVTAADLPGLEGIACIHFGSYSLVTEPTGTAFLALAERAAPRAAPTLVSLDPNLRLAISPDLALWRARVEAFLARAHLVKASEEDLAALYPGRPAEDSARDWAGRGPSLVVVTRGAEGAFAVSPAGELRVPGRAVEVVDTVGAGDTFQAGLLAALAEMGRATPQGLAALTADETRRALAFATGAAAITCTRRGADLPRRAELPTV
ncbi:MAG TPA: carbohydrate kinase [Paracoccaceae bacterium]|nr:carbohydrate kinase [Paracoccaceae bacterium]